MGNTVHLDCVQKQPNGQTLTKITGSKIWKTQKGKYLKMVRNRAFSLNVSPLYKPEKSTFS